MALVAAAPVQSEIARFEWFDYRGEDPVDRELKSDAEHYRNPILSGFYPDPSILRVGEDYYLVNSTFAYFPGLPVFHSRDLVSWTQIGNAIDRSGQVDFKTLELSRGMFAPSIAWHDGLFYLTCTCVDCGGNFVLTAQDPAGPWSDPRWLDVDGIDPSLFFDEDGSAWLINNGEPPEKPRYDGHRAIWIQRLDVETLKLVGSRTVLVDGGVRPAEKPIWAEGPHIFRKNDFYYLITAEGGTAEGHSEVVWRSRKVTGPYEPGPRNPILTQRDLDPKRPNPVTSAGHAAFVETPAGEWWTTFLATRPYRDDHYNIGRETFLLPVSWHDGWPEVLKPGTPIPLLQRRPALPASPPPRLPQRGAFAIRDDFGGQTLGGEWMRIRASEAPWLQVKDGALTLEARPVALGSAGHPSYIGRRLQHHWASVATAVRFTSRRAADRAGIAVLQNQSHFYALTVSAGSVQLQRRASPSEPEDGIIVASKPIETTGDAPIELRIDARGDRYDFLYAPRAGDWQMLAADQDGTILSTKSAGGFVGATVGLFARSAD